MINKELSKKISFCFFKDIYLESSTFVFLHLFICGDKANGRKRSLLITFLYFLNLFIQIVLRAFSSPVIYLKLRTLVLLVFYIC